MKKILYQFHLKIYLPYRDMQDKTETLLLFGLFAMCGLTFAYAIVGSIQR